MRQRLLPFVLMHMFLHCVCGDLRAQEVNDSVVSQKVAELSRIWLRYNGLTLERETTGDFSASVRFFHDTQPEDTSYMRYMNAAAKAERKTWNDNWGLSAGANYQRNYNGAASGFFADDVSGDQLIYLYRYQYGLDWNAFKDGLVSNHIRGMEVPYQLKIDKLKSKQKLLADNYIQKTSLILYQYNRFKMELLETRKLIIGEKLGVVEELHALKRVPYLDIVRIMQENTDVNGMLQVYRGYNSLLEGNLCTSPASFKDKLALVDMKPEILFSEVNLSSETKVLDSIAKLQIKILKLKYNPLNDLDVHASVKYNYYDAGKPDPKAGIPDIKRDFYSVGVGVAVPVPFGFLHNKKYVDAQSQMLFHPPVPESQEDRFADLANYMYEYRYKLKQYLNFYGKMNQYAEQIRVERIKQQFGDEEFSPVASLDVLDQFLNVKIEMLDLQQQMYVQLLRIEAKYPEIKMADCIIPVNVDSLNMTQNTQLNKSIYVWSEALSEFPVTYLAEYLVLNKYKTAVISLRKDGKGHAEAEALADTLFMHHIASEILVGNNKLLFRDNISAALDSVVALGQAHHFTAIHLDVEPQAFPGFKTEEEKYMKAYIALLRLARSYCNSKDMKLNVSVPLRFKDEYLAEIYSLADNVYYMAYENIKADYIQRKTAPGFAISKSKTFIALRTNDFTSRHELDDFMLALSVKLKTDNFAVHDLGRVIHLDHNQVKGVKDN